MLGAVPPAVYHVCVIGFTASTVITATVQMLDLQLSACVPGDSLPSGTSATQLPP